MAFDANSLFNTYLGIKSYRDKKEDRAERTRLADRQLDLQAERQEEQQRQFNIKTTEARNNQVGIDAYRTSLTDLNTSQQASDARKEANKDREERANSVLTRITGHPGSFEGSTLVNFNVPYKKPDGSDGHRPLVLNRAYFKEEIRRNSPIINELLGGTFNQLPIKNAANEEGYGHTQTAKDQNLLVPAGKNEAGEDLYLIRGSYPDGEGSILTDKGTSAGDDLGTPMTADQIFDAFELDFKSNILSGTDAGRSFRNTLRVSYAQVNIKDDQLEAAKEELTGQVMTGVKGLAQYKDDPKLARELYSIFTDKNTSQDDKDMILYDLADQMGIEIPSIVKDSQDGNIQSLSEDSAVQVRRGETPKDILGERGTITQGSTPYNDHKGHSSLLLAVAMSGKSKTFQQARMGTYNKKISNARDRVAELQDEILTHYKEIESAHPDAKQGIEDTIDKKVTERTKLINGTNSDIFEAVETNLTRYKSFKENARTDKQKAHWQGEIDRADREKQELLREGLITPAMQKKEYSNLIDKIFGPDGKELLKNGDANSIQTILKNLDSKLSGGLSFSDTEKAIAQEAAEEAGITAERDRLASAPLEHLIVAKALMIAGTDSESEKRYLSTEIDNFINTGDTTLSTEQERNLQIQAGQVQASQMNANANFTKARTALKKQLSDAEAAQDQVMIDRNKLTMERVDSIQDFMAEVDIDEGPDRWQRVAKYANKSFFGDHATEFARDYSAISLELEKFVERDAEGNPTRIIDQVPYDMLADIQEELTMNLIQYKAKQGFANNFKTIYGANSFRNLRADSADPKKMTEFFFVNEAGKREGGAVKISSLNQLVRARDALISRVMINDLIMSEGRSPTDPES